MNYPRYKLTFTNGVAVVDTWRDNSHVVSYHSTNKVDAIKRMTKARNVNERLSQQRVAHLRRSIRAHSFLTLKQADSLARSLVSEAWVNSTGCLVLR